MVKIDLETFEILKDTSFLLKKKQLTGAIVQLLAATELKLKVIWSECSLPVHIKRTGKISKGESYQDLPYFMLDFPREFSKSDTFAFRTMIWWGNEISFTLHLSGKFKNAFQEKLENNIQTFSTYFLCVNKSPWEYHFKEDNYQKIEHLSSTRIKELCSNDFIKISNKISLDQLVNLPTEASITFRNFLSLLID